MIFKDSFRNYYVLVLPIEVSKGFEVGNVGLLKYYRKKGRAGSKTEISSIWNAPSEIDDAIPQKDFDKWYQYILKHTTNQSKKEVLRLVLSNKFKQ